MKRIDIMVDLETLGTTPENPIIQLAAVAFDITTGEILSKFNKFVKLSECSKINPDTLAWWLKTDKELFTHILEMADCSEHAALQEFEIWVENIKHTYAEALRMCLTYPEIYLWGNGILFDNNFIRTKMLNYGLIYPIKYRNDRDVRTIVDLYMVKTGKTYEEVWAEAGEGLLKHDASDDCLAQIKLVSKAYTELTNPVDKTV